jgi:hypothetical protein
MLSSLLNQAIKAGAVVVAGSSDALGFVNPADRATFRLSAGDMAIAATAIGLQKQRGQDAVSVITLDHHLGGFLAKYGIPWIQPEVFLASGNANEADPKTLESANSIVRSQHRYIILSALAGAVAALLGNAAYDKLAYLVATVSVWGTLLAIFGIGIGLFWYRERYRLSYGVSEFLVGFMMSGYVFYPSFDFRQLDVVRGIQLLGGLYVMVRGLDNIARGVENTRFERLWKQLF